MTGNQRIEFAERQGWKQLERCTKTLEDWPICTAKEKKIWYLDHYGQVAYWTPSITSREDVHTALMEMSGEEWEKFVHCFLNDSWEDIKKFQDPSWEAVMKSTAIATLKTPLATLVECFLEATKGRVKL